jgi:hypothetical protein
MALYALCLHPLLRTLEETLNGVHIGGTIRISPILAYADDITVLVTQPSDFDTIEKTVHTYEKATGARLNTQDSKDLAITNWTAPATALGMNFQGKVTILGIKFAATLGTTMKVNWDIIKKTRVQAERAYGRHLSLAKRLQYAQQYC